MQKILILNVDDNPSARYAKTRVLQNAGFQVEEADNGGAALAMVEQLLPALVLLDVKLPDISRHEVCRRIKANPLTGEVRVLQISAALISEDDSARGLESGADCYLAAPFEPKDLVSKVRALLRTHSHG